jgi:hypothetical protein
MEIARSNYQQQKLPKTKVKPVRNGKIGRGLGRGQAARLSTINVKEVKEDKDVANATTKNKKIAAVLDQMQHLSGLTMKEKVEEKIVDETFEPDKSSENEISKPQLLLGCSLALNNLTEFEQHSKPYYLDLFNEGHATSNSLTSSWRSDRI